MTKEKVSIESSMCPLKEEQKKNKKKNNDIQPEYDPFCSKNERKTHANTNYNSNDDHRHFKPLTVP